MSRAPFDPNKFRVEDLFAAKEERRQRLAGLPLEEKIKIVKKLQAGVSAAMKNERLIFESFLRTFPDFASEPIEEWDTVEVWYTKRAFDPPPHPFDRRPDIIAVTASGRRIGVELKSWLNREEITEARKQERIQENILKAIGTQPRNETQHVGLVWLSAKQVRFDAANATEFRAQMFGLIEKVDRDWDQETQAPKDCDDDLAQFPVLEKYLNGVRFHPAARNRFETRWIRFPSPGGAYSPREMLTTLISSLNAHKTDERYKKLGARIGLDDVYLLVHYDFKAFAYNTPFDAPNFGFKEAAKVASEALGGDCGYFDRIFLFHFLLGKEEAYELCSSNASIKPSP